MIFGAMMAAATNTPSSAAPSTPTATPTARPSTPTATPTAHASATSTSTPTATPQASPSLTSTPSPTPSATATATATSSASPSPTGSPTVTATPEPGAVTDLVLIANGARLPLVVHTAESRALLKAQGGLWALMDLDALTHYVADVPLPSDRAMVVSVDGTLGSTDVVIVQLMHTPPDAVRALGQLASSAGGLKNLVDGQAERLQLLGLTPDQVSTAEHLAQLQLIGDNYSTAAAIVMHHPNVATIDPTSAAATTTMLVNNDDVRGIATSISTLRGQGQQWSTKPVATNPDGSPAQIFLGPPSIVDRFNFLTTFQTIKFNQDTNFQGALQKGISTGVKLVRNTGDLGQVIDKPVSAYPVGTPFKTWTQPQGATPQSKSYTPPPGAEAGGIQATLKVAYEPFQVPVSNGLTFGMGTQMTSGYTDGEVKLTIYNNFVRWVWAYVQYIGKDGKNLSTGAGKWPDTKYSKSLALVPQVFTLLGVPLWDTNSIPVTLNFPQGAHTARLLYCGLGSNIAGVDWRQYFPADAYPDAIAPSDEVLFPALLTGILTIGLNVFALATDLDIATTWAAIGKMVKADPTTVRAAMEALMNGSGFLTGAETLATTVAAGAATYEEVSANGGSTQNIWGILLGLGSAIPKILFNPKTGYFWAQVAVEILGLQAADKIEEAIPFIGEVIAVIEAVGDAITLAEAIGETIASPWLIENEVNLTYTATVTIEPDQRLEQSDLAGDRDQLAADREARRRAAAPLANRQHERRRAHPVRKPGAADR